MKIFLMKDIVWVTNSELLVENNFEQEINS
jgi:hypothetical protein